MSVPGLIIGLRTSGGSLGLTASLSCAPGAALLARQSARFLQLEPLSLLPQPVKRLQHVVQKHFGGRRRGPSSP